MNLESFILLQKIFYKVYNYTTTSVLFNFYTMKLNLPINDIFSFSIQGLVGICKKKTSNYFMYISIFMCLIRKVYSAIQGSFTCVVITVAHFIKHCIIIYVLCHQYFFILFIVLEFLHILFFVLTCQN